MEGNQGGLGYDIIWRQGYKIVMKNFKSYVSYNTSIDEKREITRRSHMTTSEG